MIPHVRHVGYPRLAVAATLALLLVAVPGQAANCSVSPQNLSFGLYDPFSSSASDTAATIAVSCDAETAFEIALGPGTESYTARTMVSGADTMVYNLYINPQRTLVWGAEREEATQSAPYPRKAPSPSMHARRRGKI